MFEQATKNKFRFETQQGALLSVEDLWDLPLQHSTKPSLDAVAIRLSRAIKQTEEESFVFTKTAVGNGLQDKLDVVKHIISVKLKEQADREDSAKKRAMNNKILDILAQKEEEDLLKKSPEELKALIQP